MKSKNAYSIIFEIHLNPNKNDWNIFDISSMSLTPEEFEILLYPYFSFKVK